MKRRLSPNAAFASADAERNAFASSDSDSTMRIPRPPPPARSLDGHRITEFRRAARCGFFVRDDTAAPRHDWNARIFGDSLRVDLVAKRSHDITGWPQEKDPLFGDPIRKVGIFRDESPTRPHRVRARAYEQRDQPIVIEIGRDGTVGRVEPNRMVRVTDKGRVAIDVGIDRDRLEIRTLERSQRLDGTNAANCRFPAIEDGDPANGVTGAHWRPLCWASGRTAKPG